MMSIPKINGRKRLGIDEAEQCEKEIKEAIKKLYIENKDKTKLIEDYEKAFIAIKNEYSLLYNEYEALKKIVDKKEKDLKLKRTRYEIDNESDNENNNIQYIVKKKKKPKIIYVEDEDDDMEQVEEIEKQKEQDEKKFLNKMETQTKNKNEIDILQKIKKNNRKGISKAIKF